MKVVHFLLLAWFVIFVSSRLPGEIEAYFLPVLKDIRIEIAIETAADARSTGRQTMKLHFTEIRKNCDLNAMYWYKLMNNGTKIRLKTYAEDLIVDEKDNSKRTIIWTIPIQTSEFLIKSDSVLFDYSCHPFWNTYVSVQRSD